jgi:methylenetetrahydrofolate reductase (NADPH)
LTEWGTPTTSADLSALFCAYLNSLPSAPTTPFCDLPLSPESQTILQHLIALNSVDKQYWTVGSQPAVDAAYSDDSIHGWGPKGGYVFQKAFVEFFVPSKEVDRLEERLKRDGGEAVSMYAANKAVSPGTSQSARCGRPTGRVQTSPANAIGSIPYQHCRRRR